MIAINKSNPAAAMVRVAFNDNFVVLLGMLSGLILAGAGSVAESIALQFSVYSMSMVCFCAKGVLWGGVTDLLVNSRCRSQPTAYNRCL
jgi:hypothetical protein